jgi:hypothetical protein
MWRTIYEAPISLPATLVDHNINGRCVVSLLNANHQTCWRCDGIADDFRLDQNSDRPPADKVSAIVAQLVAAAEIH